MSMPVTELTAEQLRQTCDPGQFSFHSTAELPELEEVIGQERALRAMAFGVDIHDSGYHMYALGPSGTGKTTTVKRVLERDAQQKPVPDDWLYVNNFANADKPRAFRLPPGLGCKFRADMDKLVDELQSAVPRAFEGADYSRQQEQMGGDFQKRNQALIKEAEDFARSKEFVLLQTPQGMMIAPVINGNIMPPEQLRQLDDEARQKMEKNREEVEQKLRDTMRQLRDLQREARDKGTELDRDTVAYAVGHLIDDLKDQYAQFVPIQKLLDEIRADILENAQTIKQVKQLQQMQSEQGPMALLMGGGRAQLSFDQYRVNLIVDNCSAKGAPVILARNPSYNNLVGRIEHQGQFGTLVTNFRMIKSGLLHAANGGYLMIDVIDLFTKPLAWEALKRALKTGVIEIETPAEMYGLFMTRTLEPEPIPLELKVILIGDPYIYYLLYAMDPDFRDLFKVKVDFATRMDRTSKTTEQYAQLIGTVCREEKLKHFDPSGVAKIVEHGARMIEHQNKLVTKFGDIVDIIRQASYWASKSGHELVNGDDVKKTIEEKVYRSNQIEQLLQEAIIENTLFIDTEGAVTGQINGIAVMSPGDYAFGKPSRITARIHIGNSGVVNIDREVKMGGPIHNKGALILAGYLGGKYAGDTPLALTASITFEQVYDEIEGDSASSVELYALLSALSGYPIRQDFAVTGSVNQLGQVQPIGGVNEKIEGFFDVCRERGLTGRQGVMIPHSNAKHLMLREDVVEAVRQGQFHIYPVATIDEGIALLTGKPAGERRADGSYPDGTVNAAVHKRLSVMAQKVKDFMRPEGKTGGEEDEAPPKAA